MIRWPWRSFTGVTPGASERRGRVCVPWRQENRVGADRCDDDHSLADVGQRRLQMFRPKVTAPMTIVPVDHEDTAAPPTGLMAIVHGWLADLSQHPDARRHRLAALQRELDAVAWRLVGRLDGIDACEEEAAAPDSAGHG